MNGTSTRLGALLLLLSGNMLIDALEVSTLAVALPAIGADFGLSPSATSWFMTGFAAGFGGSILLGNWLTDRYGRRQVYLYALLGFAVASVLAAVAQDPYLLAATRVVKGVCVAFTAPTGVAIIARTFPEGATRNRALAVYSLFGASGFSVGLLLSGALTEVSWRWTLFVSGPAALLLYLAGLRIIPRDRPTPAAASGRGDDPGAARLILAGSLAAFAGFFWYAVAGPEHGYLIGVLPAVSGIGVGMMLSFSALHVQAVSGVTPGRQALATGLYQTSVQIGGGLVLALVAAAALAGRSLATAVVVAVSAAGLLIAVSGSVTGQRDRERRASWTQSRSM